MHKVPSAKCSCSNVSLLSNSLEVIFVQTAVSYFPTSDFNFLRTETKSNFRGKISNLLTLLAKRKQR